MPSSSRIAQKNRAQGLPLSRPMVDLLGKMLSAIDKRRHMLDVGEEEYYEPETCAACCGVGFLLIPIESLVEISEDEEGEENGEEGASEVITPEMATFFNVNSDGADSAEASDSPAPATAAGQSDSDAAVVGITAHTSVPPTPVPTTSGSAPVVPAVATPTVVSTIAPTIPTNVSAIPSVTPATTAPAAVPGPAASLVVATPVNAGPINAMTPPNGVPAPSHPIPGFNSLGPNFPVPTPTTAVFTDNNADRFYCVIKGIRLDRQNTSPYVQGVGGASFSRHSSLDSAYQAYVQAFSKGFVTYV
ncbi:hypothetical protein NMY22_g8372 [Coprinellus aureogranulatus]|nr:hypothetical protein NMY22_g8372 [Coprinellus aureogranulatus]